MFKFIKRWEQREEKKLTELQEIRKQLALLTSCVDTYGRGEPNKLMTSPAKRY